MDEEIDLKEGCDLPEFSKQTEETLSQVPRGSYWSYRDFNQMHLSRIQSL